MEFLNKQPKSTVLPRTIGFWAAVAKFDACPKDGKLDTGCSVMNKVAENVHHVCPGI